MISSLNLLSVAILIWKTIPDALSWRLYCQKDARSLDQKKRGDLESKVQSLANKLAINKPIQLIEITDITPPMKTQGNALLPGKAGIAFDPEFADQISEEEFEFWMAHQLVHIKANDFVWFAVVPIAIGVITTIAMSVLFPSSATHFSIPGIYNSHAAAIGIIASAISIIFFSRWREASADKLGSSICSEAVKKAGLAAFNSMAKDNIEYRNEGGISLLSSLWRKFLLTSDGNSRFNILYPSIQTRITYLSQSIAHPSSETLAQQQLN